MNSQIVFLGGIFLENQMSAIETRSIGVVQNAADVLQKAFLRGISRVFLSELTLVNLPFINSYPRGYHDIYFPGGGEATFEKFRVISKGWINLEIARIFFRVVAAFSGLKRALAGRPGVIVLYSAHLPFLAASILAKKIHGAKTCLILPDFPEFMGEGGALYKLVKWCESRVFYFLAKRIDYFVVLTPFMADRLGIESSRFCVIEGMAYIDTNRLDSAALMPRGSRRIFLYTGTLAARYGIRDLLSAFSLLEDENAELWICGDGDSREAVQDLAARDGRLTYFGQVSRQRAVELQQQAHVLVNPRPPNDEYTKYSFPSKTIEYLAAARPIIMHQLPGMSAEYIPYMIVPDTADVTGLLSALRRAAGMSIESLQEMGEKGRKFVRREKSPEKQCEKILRMLHANGLK